MSGYFYDEYEIGGYYFSISAKSLSPRATPYGIQMTNDSYQGTYILPPNNRYIPKIPLIVEEIWYHNASYGSNVIALFGNTNQQIKISDYTSTSNLSTFVQFSYSKAKLTLESAVINQNLESLDIPLNLHLGTKYSF